MGSNCKSLQSCCLQRTIRKSSFKVPHPLRRQDINMMNTAVKIVFVFFVMLMLAQQIAGNHHRATSGNGVSGNGNSVLNGYYEAYQNRYDAEAQHFNIKIEW